MANKKQINTKSSKRLSELIKELNMNYADFGESVNLSEYTIRSYTNGVRRLTEDNARIIVKKYPIVRFEWLMGWDDCKTEKEVKRAQLWDTEEHLFEDEFGWWRKELRITEILKIMGYIVSTTKQRGDGYEEIDAEYDNSGNGESAYRMARAYITEDSSLVDDVVLGKMTEHFSKQEIEYALWRLKHNIEQPNCDELPNTIEDSVKDWDERSGFVYNKRYYVFDKNDKIVTEFSGAQYTNFVSEMYNVISALIKFHIREQED